MKDDTTAKSKLINAKTRRRQEKQNLFQKKTKPKGVSMDFLEVELKILCGFAPLR